MNAIASTLGVASSNLVARLTPAEPKRRGRPPQSDDDLLVPPRKERGAFDPPCAR